ncbi:MAG TPA: pyridoxal phosphate-dependent aminotransferase [Chitinophagaceae bacterium]|jgi:aspartate aminotransferase|nr:pyridoxal phosphate-dependent aminotransferase [Chitinophagaceae bacterium]HNF45499.1 pyridoxal phosphate-dependent aminotransferase [Chitinophagaceae bacterium]HNJ55002.1 pyridoxal phosphate-dependent aminotransferase [Chitinophagaceae bacterium]HNL58738.1 pyridoxal phosphate-dependent aminotransferase [Chitinophagaceae bacterium]HNO54612.1 pyridoxal phosphate-dependent aminotransferase [Chitinophagaceae bacterium]
MLNISQRGQLMPPSPIRKLVPYAEAAKQKGIKVFHLNIGQPDIETPPAILDAVRNADIKVLEYSHSAGNESYRKKLVQYYKSVGIDVTAEQIIITTGGSEAIMFGFFTCLNPGDEVIIPEPFYANYNGFACAAGVSVVPITSHIENGFALPPISDFEKVITNKTKAIIICSPNNPTGYLYSREEMEALKQICLKHNLYLFSDEAYREFCYDGEYVSAMHLSGLEDHVVLMDTISKRYSACGARLGAFVTKNKEVYNSAMKFAQARLSPPGLAQIMGEAAVDLPASYFDAPKAEYLKRRDKLVSRLNKMPGVFCPNPGGAFYAIAKLPIDDADKFCQWLLESFSYKNQTVMLAPATGFYGTPGLGKNEVRLAYVLNVEAIDAAMDCLEQALLVYPGKVLQDTNVSAAASV